MNRASIVIVRTAMIVMRTAATVRTAVVKVILVNVKTSVEQLISAAQDRTRSHHQKESLNDDTNDDFVITRNDDSSDEDIMAQMTMKHQARIPFLK